MRSTPSVILRQVSFSATLQLNELKNGSVYPREVAFQVQDSTGNVLSNGTFVTLDQEGNFQTHFTHSVHHLNLPTYGSQELVTTVSAVVPESENASVPFTTSVHSTVFVSPGWLSLLPPLITLIMSAVLSQVLIALLAGIWVGATIVEHGNPFTGFLRTFDKYWADAFITDGHAGVLLFTIVLGGTIGVVQKGGGGHGLALLAKRFMTTSLRMQLSTWLLCLVIFFDDYSCILIIGSSLRQVLSQTGVSREKFAAIIHTIGVCLPSMAPVSSWIGVEIGYVAAQIKDLKLDWDPFLTCLSCLHYRFFPILFIALIFITIICEKDFGPMVQFEKDAAASPIQTNAMTPVMLGPCASPAPELGPLEPDTQKPLRWQNAVIPFATIMILTFLGMILDGFSRLYDEDPDGSYGLLDALSSCNSVSALIRASAAGWVLSVVMLLAQRIVTLDQATRAWMEGVKDILDPTLILVLAWALGNVIGEVNVAPYIASVVGDGIKKEFLPAIACVLCYIVSFATGSAFGTMAIMFPIISPLSFSISGGDTNNLLQCFGSILGASVFGNTCSPIADTSILASLSAHIPLENHVRSIMPYALLVATISVVGGSLPIGLNILSPFTAFGVCIAVLLLLVFFCGTRVNSRFRALSSYAIAMATPETPWTVELTPTNNPYLEFYHEFCKKAPKDMHRMFDPTLSDKKRAKLYDMVDVGVAMKYSWAIPDERALQIIKHYGPIVEMGAGTGYWGCLLKVRGVDIVCYDLHVADDDDDENGDAADGESDEAQEEDDDSGEELEGDEQEDGDDDDEGEGDDSDGQPEYEESDSEDEEEIEIQQVYWTEVLKGTPKMLRKHSDRALFLCYPDDFEDSDESMALECLNNYSGDTVIHVGEMLGQTLCLPDAWGRTSAPEFQVRLASLYHKVLQVPLPSWHSSIDTLTVWKRTKTCIMDNTFYAYIPPNERIDLVQACDDTRQLLDAATRANVTPVTNSPTKKSPTKKTPTKAQPTKPTVQAQQQQQSNKKKNASKQQQREGGAGQKHACKSAAMKSPKRALSYLAEYQFGDDNLLTATLHEELRVRNDERVKHAQSVLKLRELSLHNEESGLNNAKKQQQEQDRKYEISHDNYVLLERLERIHQHLPKQFDVSHHREEVLNAPRATNANARRREQERILEENKRIKRRLNATKGSFDLKKLAADAEMHDYWAGQISKVERRRKVRESCKAIHDQAIIKAAAEAPEQFHAVDRSLDDDYRVVPPPPTEKQPVELPPTSTVKPSIPVRFNKLSPQPKLPHVVSSKSASKYATGEYFPAIKHSNKHVTPMELLKRSGG
ncbi:TPA: hypothetical protein N0F65_003770 [Lagenidium giganteum]|uniref:Na+/H+ antiporter NhaC-like C-terminal domain-containing protein n=1 Tax=Lagenidium giganteum TaxID=4803 RepID=A0AAV2YB69_9STRA|nr:TPA: hypothetical protein N0F65_003770 [Lagenidium giganteum]